MERGKKLDGLMDGCQEGWMDGKRKMDGLMDGWCMDEGKMDG